MITPSRVATPLLFVAVLLLSSANASAQTFTYIGPSTGTVNWSAGMWTPGTPPVGGGATVNLVFSPMGSGNVTVNNNLGNPFQLANLTLNSAGGGLRIGNVAGNSLQFVDVPGVGIVQSGIGVAEISAPFSWSNSGMIVSGTGPGNLRLTGQLVSASTELTINNPQSLSYTGLVVLTQANVMPSATLIAGNLVLNNNQALGAQPITINGGTIGGFATLPNAVTLNAPLIFNGFGSPIYNGVISGNQGIVVRTLGGGDLTLRNANTYSGPTSASLNPDGFAAAGSLIFSGPNGSALNSPSFTFAGGGLLILDNSLGGNNNRIANTVPVSLSGANTSGESFRLVGAPGGSTTEQIGALTGNGAVFVAVNAATAGNTGTTLIADSLIRQNRAQFHFFGNNTNFGGPIGANVANVRFTNAPGPLVGGGGAGGTTTISILPYAFGAFTFPSEGTDLVTYGAANGIRPLAANEYATSITSGTTTQDNVKLSAAAATITAPTTINALVTTGFQSFSGSTSTLTLTSGTLLGDAVNVPSEMTLNFGAAEANFLIRTGMSVDGVLTGTNGLTKAGNGNLTLLNPANNVTGTLTINRGAVFLLDPAALNSFSNIVVNGPPALQFTPGLGRPFAGVATLDKPISVVDGFVNLSGGLTVAGQISGPGGVVVSGGTVTLTNVTNNYTGPTRVLAGTLVIPGDAALGAGGGVIFGGSAGTVGPRLTGNWTTSRQIQFTDFGNQVDTNGFTWTVNSPLTGETPSINKIGAGAWVLTQGGALGQSTTSGVLTTTTTINVNAGELRVTNPSGSATGTATVNINSGGTLAGTGRIAGAATVASGGFVAAGVSSIDTLRFGSSLTMNGTYLAELNASASDLLSITGGLTLNASSALDLSGAANPVMTYVLATFETRTGTFGTVNNLPATHNLVYLSSQIALVPVPEPAFVLLAGSVGLGVIYRRWRQTKSTISI